MMLTMDLSHLAKAELAEAVTHYCNQFGDIKTITILKPPERPDAAFVLISMKSDDALQRVVHAFGATRVASLAVIRIEHAAPAIPASLLKNSRTVRAGPRLND